MNAPEPVAEPLLNMDDVKVDPRWALRIPGNLAVRRQLLPFTIEGGKVLVACANPDDRQGLKAVERYVALPVHAQPAEERSLERAIQRIFLDSAHGSGQPLSPGQTMMTEFTGDGESDGDQIVALCDEIFHAAQIREATDIHILPGRQEVRIRFRVDGVLEDYRSIPQAINNSLVSRLKVLAGMDIAERRAPQDGRFTIGSEASQAVDVRAATVPTKQGERMTLRLLATQTENLTLENLGMAAADNEIFERNIFLPNGLILLTGPTGCGKSTTLYAAIRRLIASRSLNVITIEDPVEYVIDGISQVEVDSSDRVTFHRALRSSLRHDPDVLMIGEIRDEETAETAIKAALTGHLVFTTLHTNSAVSSITRLVDMGVEPYLIAAVARVLIAQRLVRRLCPHCRRQVALTGDQAQALNRPELEGQACFEPAGCRYCAGTGFAGRTGLFELLEFNRELARQVAAGLRESEIEELAREQGFRPLVEDALRKIETGVTSFEEVISIVNLI